jgi:hypothetical protein
MDGPFDQGPEVVFELRDARRGSKVGERALPPSRSLMGEFPQTIANLLAQSRHVPAQQVPIVGEGLADAVAGSPELFDLPSQRGRVERHGRGLQGHRVDQLGGHAPQLPLGRGQPGPDEISVHERRKGVEEPIELERITSVILAIRSGSKRRKGSDTPHPLLAAELVGDGIGDEAANLVQLVRAEVVRLVENEEGWSLSFSQRGQQLSLLLRQWGVRRKDQDGSVRVEQNLPGGSVVVAVDGAQARRVDQDEPGLKDGDRQGDFHSVHPSFVARVSGLRHVVRQLVGVHLTPLAA